MSWSSKISINIDNSNSEIATFIMCSSNNNKPNLAEVYIFEHGRYISTLKHVRMSILSNYVHLPSIYLAHIRMLILLVSIYVPLACINTIYKYC